MLVFPAPNWNAGGCPWPNEGVTAGAGAAAVDFGVPNENAAFGEAAAVVAAWAAKEGGKLGILGTSAGALGVVVRAPKAGAAGKVPKLFASVGDVVTALPAVVAAPKENFGAAAASVFPNENPPAPDDAEAALFSAAPNALLPIVVWFAAELDASVLPAPKLYEGGATEVAVIGFEADLLASRRDVFASVGFAKPNEKFGTAALDTDEVSGKAHVLV